MVASQWQLSESSLLPGKPQADFVRHEGFPQGVMVLKVGKASLAGLQFASGTIEFDLKPLAADIPGITFRLSGPAGKQDGEEFYVRAFPDCRASNDCIQYVPVIHGFMLWNAYPQYQTQAMVLDGWNHVKLVVSGERMLVFVNRQAQPVLVVGKLESGSAMGALELRGPAMFANLTVLPGAVEGLPAKALPDPTAGDANLVRGWQVAGSTSVWHRGIPAEYGQHPSAAESWAAVGAGRFGMLNLNRQFVFAETTPAAVAWVRTLVSSDRDQARHVSLGWLGEVWVFVNGKLVTEGKNFYDPGDTRRDPDGRMSLENGSFDLPLRKGVNEVMLAVVASGHDSDHGPNRYGWGVEMRFDDVKGLKLGR